MPRKWQSAKDAQQDSPCLSPVPRHQGQRVLLALPQRQVPWLLPPDLRHQGQRYLPTLLRRHYRRLFSLVLEFRRSRFQVPIYRSQSRTARERQRRGWSGSVRGKEWRLEFARNGSETCSRLSVRPECGGRQKRGIESRRRRRRRGRSGCNSN